MNAPCVAVVESDTALREELVSKLSARGYTTTALADGSAFRQALTDLPPLAVVVIDLALAGEGSQSLTRHLRQSSKTTGIVVLSEKNTVSNRLQAQRDGADNYLVKPLDMDELVAVVDILVRQANASAASRQDWRLDDVYMTLTSPHDTKIELTLGEVELVRALARRGDHFADRDALIKSMGKDPDCYDPRALEVMVSRLRRKLGAHAPLKAVRARGYIFAADLQLVAAARAYA